MSRVWVYPEKEYRELGEERFHIEWSAVKKSAMGKEDLDFDEDLVTLATACKTKEAAIAKAKRALESKNIAFGAVTLTRQTVGWFVEGDRIAEWQDTMEREEITA